jgi:uronate dehydrogenase
MPQASTKKPFHRLLLTGAGGGLGNVLRERIKPWADIVRLSDVRDLGPAAEGEEIMCCDLADNAAVLGLLEGVDAVLHFGGISVEDRFEPIMQANILGLYNLYEAVHKAGVKRVIYASSNHVTGFYRNTEVVDADMPVRPDGFYGLSKCFGEALSRYYFDRFGIETVCVRIGSSFPEPKSARMMTTYLSYDDLVELLRCALFTPRVGHTIVFGTSDNDATWWDNRKAGHLGFKPKDSSRPFKHLFPDTAERPDDNDPATVFQGGPFVTTGPMY